MGSYSTLQLDTSMCGSIKKISFYRTKGHQYYFIFSRNNHQISISNHRELYPTKLRHFSISQQRISISIHYLMIISMLIREFFHLHLIFNLLKF